MTSLERARTGAAERLRAAGCDDPAGDALRLLCAALRISNAEFFAHGERALTGREELAYAQLVSRREQREPLKYVLGRAEFWTFALRVGPGVLCPRADTETLVRATLDRLTDRAARWCIADLGTGSGCIAAALAAELPVAKIDAIERSAAAAAYARENFGTLHLTDRVTLRQGDFFAALPPGAYDAIVSNAPYVTDAERATLPPEIARWEPPEALFAGADGLDAYREIVPRAYERLRPGGFLAVEIDPTQAGALAQIAHDARYAAVEFADDWAGRTRVVVARRG